MGFTIGRQNRGVYGSRTQVPTPQSTGFADRAQRRIDQTASMAAARLVEAVRTDGHLCHVWNRLPRGGVPCSCGGSQPQRVTEMDKDAQLFTPGVEEAISFDLARDLQPDGADEPDIGRGISLRLRGNLLSNPAELLDIPQPNDFIPATDRGSELDASPLSNESLGSDALSVPSDFSQLQSLGDLLDMVAGGDLRVCGVCYGTGFVDGFRLAEGVRIVLHAVETQPGVLMALEGVDIDRGNRPHAFNLSTVNHSVTWTFELPLHIEALALRVFDNNHPVDSEMRMEARTGSDAWETATTAWVQAHAGQTVQIRARPRQSLLSDGFLAFTHVEILLRQRNSIMVQIPQMPRNLNVEHQDPVVYTQFELEPTIEALHRESVIEVPDLGMIFRVTEVTNMQTAKHQIYGIGGQIRVVQPSEKINQMRVGGWREPSSSPYRGLERAQGGLSVGLEPISETNPNPALDRGSSDDDLLGGRALPTGARRP